MGGLLLLEAGELAKALKRLDKHHVRYAPRVSIRRIPYAKKGYHKFVVKGNMPWSEPSQLVWVFADPAKALTDQHAMVTCSCNSWRYDGSDYNAQKGNYLLFGARSNGQAPDIRDPRRRRTVCKHIWAVLKHLKFKV